MQVAVDVEAADADYVAAQPGEALRGLASLSWMVRGLLKHVCLDIRCYERAGRHAIRRCFSEQVCRDWKHGRLWRKCCRRQGRERVILEGKQQDTGRDTRTQGTGQQQQEQMTPKTCLVYVYSFLHLCLSRTFWRSSQHRHKSLFARWRW